MRPGLGMAHLAGPRNPGKLLQLTRRGVSLRQGPPPAHAARKQARRHPLAARTIYCPRFVPVSQQEKRTHQYLWLRSRALVKMLRPVTDEITVQVRNR